jgi:uncharacterized protein
MKKKVGVIRSRLPTLAVIVAALLCLVAVVALFWPVPEGSEHRHSVRETAARLVTVLQSLPEDSNPAPKDTATATAAGPADFELYPLNLGMISEPSAPLIETNSSEIRARTLDDTIMLPPAPDPIVSAKTPDGVLPIISDDGRKPWQVYARPFTDNGKQPHLILILAPLGADHTLTNAAIERLPGSITLAFDATYDGQAEFLSRARAQGHETLLVVPAEPFDYPASDPGPDTLLTNLQPAESLRRLHSFLRRGSGYIGLMTLSGSRFVNSGKPLDLFLNELRMRGLALVDTRLTERDGLSKKAQKFGVAVTSVDFQLHADLALKDFDEIMRQALRTARQAGQAVCLITATPLAIDRLNYWLLEIAKTDIWLAPVSAGLR